MSDIPESTSAGRLRGQTTSVVPEGVPALLEVDTGRPRGASAPTPPSLNKSPSFMNRLNSSFAKSKRDTPPSSPKTTAPPTPNALCPSESETSLSDCPKDSEAVPPKKNSPFFRSTQASVERALDRLLEYGPGYAKATLVLSPELLKVVPVPGVAEMARTLVSIWQETQRLDVSRSTTLTSEFFSLSSD